MMNSTSSIGFEEKGGQYKLVQTQLSKLGPRDLLIKVEAVAVNPADYKQKDYGLFLNLISSENHVLLDLMEQEQGWKQIECYQFVGSETTLFKVGDQVQYVGDITKQGSNSSLQVIVGKKPNNLTWSQSASIPLVNLSSYEALIEILGLKEENFQSNSEKTLLIVGGAGGVGSCAIQIAKKLLGVKTIETASRPETDFIINHKNPLAEELKKIGIDGVDYIFNTSDTTSAYFDQLTNIITLFGGIVGISGFSEPLNLWPTFMKRVNVTCECMFSKSLFQKHLETQHDILNHLANQFESGNLITNTQTILQFSPQSLTKAKEDCKSGVNIGKIAFEGVQEYFQAQNK